MKTLAPTRRSLLALSAAALVLLPLARGQEPDAAPFEPTVVFLVRHAEKRAEGADPALTEAGSDRAVELAAMLADAGLDAVHSTAFVRTRDTARPTAEAHGVDVELYDPRNLPDLVANLLERGGRHLVVGHSNTTPAAVRLLGGDPGAPIEEAGEYDRLYVVTRAGDGSAATVLLRYGAH